MITRAFATLAAVLLVVVLGIGLLYGIRALTPPATITPIATAQPAVAVGRTGPPTATAAPGRCTNPQMSTQAVIVRYFELSTSRDIAAVSDCFAPSWRAQFARNPTWDQAAAMWGSAGPASSLQIAYSDTVRGCDRYRVAAVMATGYLIGQSGSEFITIGPEGGTPRIFEITTALVNPQIATTTCGTAVVPTPSVASSVSPTAMWRRIADIPTARSEVAAVLAQQQRKVFVIGGFGGPDRVERYDATTDRWDRAPDLPIGVDHAMAADVAGLQSAAPQGVFVFGGYTTDGRATARSFRFDVIADRWEEIAPMPGPRAAGAAATLGSSVYIVGGADGNRLIAPTYEYNVGTRAWRTVAAIPTPRDHLAAVAVEGRVCAIGGRRLSLSDNLASFECYDPTADAWARLPDVPTARGGAGAAVDGSRVYFVGGEQPSSTYREVEIFSTRADRWTRGPDLPAGRHGLGAIVLPASKELDAQRNLITTPARLLVLAGGPTPGGSQIATCLVLDLGQ